MQAQPPSSQDGLFRLDPALRASQLQHPSALSNSATKIQHICQQRNYQQVSSVSRLFSIFLFRRDFLRRRLRTTKHAECCWKCSYSCRLPVLFKFFDERRGSRLSAECRKCCFCSPLISLFPSRVMQKDEDWAMLSRRAPNDFIKPQRLRHRYYYELNAWNHAYSIYLIPEIRAQTRQVVDLSTVKSWITECVNSHQDCDDKTSNRRLVLKVIDCQKKEGLHCSSGSCIRMSELRLGYGKRSWTAKPRYAR